MEHTISTLELDKGQEIEIESLGTDQAYIRVTSPGNGTSEVYLDATQIQMFLQMLIELHGTKATKVMYGSKNDY